MPISMEDAPGTLPDGAKKIYVSAWNAAYDSTCKDRDDRDACASKIAWSAVKQKYTKSGDKWISKSVYHEFHMVVTKASYDKATQEMRWAAVASDTEEDLRGDNMTVDLFDDFVARIEKGELAPEIWRTDFWQGGMPYLSISHYSDLDGDGVPGTIEAVYRDGNRLKSKGTLDDTPLGRAVFKALCEDLYSEKADQEDHQPIRISIGFLDYEHRHKDNGTVFSRRSITDICDECDERRPPLEFLKGLLVHEATTRVPVNERTQMEVQRSMTTRKEDAASIVGEELAEELEKKSSRMVSRSDADQDKPGMVVKSEEDEDDTAPVEEEEVTETVDKSEVEKMASVEKAGPTNLGDYVAAQEAQEELYRIGDLFYALSDVVYSIFRSNEIPDDEKKGAIEKAIDEFKSMLATRAMLTFSEAEPQSEPADESPDVPFGAAYKSLTERYEQIMADEGLSTPAARLAAIQNEATEFANSFQASFQRAETVTSDDVNLKILETLEALNARVAAVESKSSAGDDVIQRKSIATPHGVMPAPDQPKSQFEAWGRKASGLS